MNDLLQTIASILALILNTLESIGNKINNMGR